MALGQLVVAADRVDYRRAARNGGRPFAPCEQNRLPFRYANTQGKRDRPEPISNSSAATVPEVPHPTVSPSKRFGGTMAKDPRDTQAQLRHTDPSVTLRHYQKSIPASVRAAAVALESELIGESSQSIRTGFEQVRN